MAFRLREATSEDISALARLHVQTFNETHRGGRDGGPSYELRERQWRDAFAITDGSWFCFVVEDDKGELVGFANVARRFLREGITSMLLFGEASNPSNGFYEAFGAERLYSESGEFHGGYGWRDLQTLVAALSTQKTSGPKN